MTEFEIKQLQDYLNNKFETNKFIAKKRKSIDDSCEIFIDDEFIHLWIYEKSIHNVLITKNESKWASNLSESRSHEYKLSRF